MRKSLYVPAVAAVAIAAGLAVMASGQQNPASTQASGAEIAVIDIGKLMNEHPRRERVMRDFEQEVRQADAEFAEQAEKVRRMPERLNEYAPGTQEYKALEAEILRARNELNVETQMKQREFHTKQAQVYYQLFQEIVDEVAAFANYHGIAVVLRVNGDPPSLDHPDDVLRSVSRQVVWHSGNRDITPMILESLQRRFPGTPETPRGATIPSPPRR